MSLTSKIKKIRIKKRVRKNIYGTNQRPRLSVYKSNKEIYAQLIDDNVGNTLISVSSRDSSLLIVKTTKLEKSYLVGKLLADKAKHLSINFIVFDRNRFIYHGRVKALADGAREGGLKF